MRLVPERGEEPETYWVEFEETGDWKRGRSHPPFGIFRRENDQTA